MNIYVKIIADDKRFERMLSLELSGCGIEVVSDIGRYRDNLTEDNFYTVVDLDFCQKEDIAELCSKSQVIGFSYLYRKEIGEIADKCFAFLHRPFLISEFLSLFIIEGYETINDRYGKIKKLNMNTVKANKNYVIVDSENKCITWGNDRILLSEKELRIISLLYDRAGDVVSREEISRLIGAHEGNMCDVYICMLRKKIDYRLGIKLIYTIRGKGYSIRA